MKIELNIPLPLNLLAKSALEEQLVSVTVSIQVLHRYHIFTGMFD